MRAGDLRKRVTIQSATASQTGTGNPQLTWTTFAVVWASIAAKDGIEQIQAGQVNARQMVMLQMRYFAGVTNKMRVLYGTRTFEIMTVVNIDEMNRELTLTCLEVA